MIKLKISVIIPTLNCEDTIYNCLNSLKDQNLEEKTSLEIIIIDGGSTDKTIDEIKKFNVKIFKDHKSLGSSRSLGVKMATGNYIVFIDADETADQNWIKELINTPISNFDAVEGATIPLIRFSKWEKMYYFVYFLKDRTKSEIRSLFFTTNFIINSKVAKKLNFDPNLNLGEDADFSYRFYCSKYKVAHNPNAITYHKVPSTVFTIIKKEAKYGKGILTFFGKHHDLYSLKFLIQSSIYCISPVYFFRIVRKILEIKLSNSLLLFLFGMIKTLGCFIGYLQFIVKHIK